jgi:ribonuclease VapC
VIVDTSAVLAILLGEPEAERFAGLILAEPSRLSAASYVEIALRIDLLRDPARSAAVDALIHELRLEIVPVTVEQARLARQANQRFGRGSGAAARLNFGDCLIYALAKQTGESLLFKGDDFIHTDVPVAGQ